MYCNKCGKAVSDDALYCESCGSRIGNATDYQPGYQNQNTGYQNTDYQNANYQYQNMNPAKLDKNSIGLNILSFLIPIVGLILYLVSRKTSPIKAKGIGIWALIGFVINIIVYNL